MKVKTLVNVKCVFVCDCNCLTCVTNDLSKSVLGLISLPAISFGGGLCFRPGVAFFDVNSL